MMSHLKYEDIHIGVTNFTVHATEDVWLCSISVTLTSSPSWKALQADP